MRKIFALLCFVGLFGLSSTFAQTDNAQKYLREAQQYNEKAEHYEREAEQLTKKANGYTRQADNYAKKKDYRQARLYTKWNFFAGSPFAIWGECIIFISY